MGMGLVFCECGEMGEEIDRQHSVCEGRAVGESGDLGDAVSVSAHYELWH